MNSYGRIYNMLIEAKSPERHGEDVRDRLLLKASNKEAREKKEFERSGGPESDHTGGSDAVHSKIDRNVRDTKETRRRRLQTQFDLKQRLNKAAFPGATPEEGVAARAKLSRRIQRRQGLGWRAEDETEWKQRQGTPY